MKIQLIGINSKYIHPAMGVFQLVANSKYPVSYFECTIKDSMSSILDRVDLTADVIGVSIYIWNFLVATELIAKIKLIKPEIKIFVGGPETYYQSDYFLNDLKVDYIINNEAEESFNELIDYLEGNIPVEKVSNLFYKKDDQICFTYSRLPNIKKIKHDYSLIKDFKNRVIYLESSRGCYFKCSYCMASLEKRVRFFDLEQVKKDIVYLLDNGARTIKFLDRSFNVNKDYMLEILKFLASVDNHNCVFQFEIVGDMLDDEVIDYIINNIRPGYLRFEIGIQSTNDITTKAVCRRQNFEKLKENITKLLGVVTIHTDLIAGLPYEDLNSFKKTFNDSYLLNADELQLGFLKELKGTKISVEKQKYKYSFMLEPPYEIFQNMFITHPELQLIHAVEEGLEKYHNKGNFKKTMNYLFFECKLDPFETFRRLYVYNESFINKQHDEVSKNLYLCCKDLEGVDPDFLLYLIKQDYLEKFNVRPKIWWDLDIDRLERNEIYKEVSSKYAMNIDILFNYARIEKYKNQYYIIIYTQKKQIITYNKI